MKKMFFLVLLFFSKVSFGQISDDLVKVKIEHGETSKEYVNGILKSFVVEMYAVNYGNALTFLKENDTISINNAMDSSFIIKLFFKNGMPVREILCNDKLVSHVEVIDFDINNLPKNSIISSAFVRNKMESYLTDTHYENIQGENIDKSLKLFSRLDYRTDLTSLDAVFNSLAEFFSEEDALLKIYWGSYSEMNPPIVSSYLKTNDSGKIENGIIWTENSSGTGKYDIYKDGTIVKTEDQNLTDFQETIMIYYSEIEDEY